MKRFSVFVASLVFAFAADQVLADQCAYITHKQAENAKVLLSAGREFANFCEPCGDTAFPLDALERVKTSQVNYLPGSETGLHKDYWELRVNGRGVDLAYVYLRRADGVFVNMAKRTGCPATGVTGVFGADGLPLTRKDSWSTPKH